MAEPCPVIETQPPVTYHILTIAPNECVQWMGTHNWNYHRMVKVNQDQGGKISLGVSRIVTPAGDILPAKWPNNNANAFTIKSGRVFHGPVFDVLVVNKACSLRWVYYDASSDKLLPIGAIKGGHWADGTPLYVAVIYTTHDSGPFN